MFTPFALYLVLVAALLAIFLLLLILKKNWFPAFLFWCIGLVSGVWYFEVYSWSITSLMCVVTLYALAVKNKSAFKRALLGEIAQLRGVQEHSTIEISEEDLKRLPDILQKWLHKSGIEPGVYPTSVYLRQEGEMRTAEKGNWMPFVAHQLSFISTPGFIWRVQVRFSRWLKLNGRDLYEKGKGSMLIRLGYLFRVVNSSGPKIDQGTLLRFLGELVWLPQAVVLPCIKWEQIDDKQVKVTMKYGKLEEEGRFTFSDEGAVIRFEAQRYMSGSKKPWIVTLSPDVYEQFGSVRVPVKSEVSWMLDGRKWTWLKIQVKELAPINETREKALL